MEKCRYYFEDLVYIDFEDEKIIGEVQGHRITKEGHILYKIDNVSCYVPVTKVHILTDKQKNKYNKFISNWQGNTYRTKEEFIKAMQIVFKDGETND